VKNAAALAKPLRMEEGEAEVEPYSLHEIERLLVEARRHRNSARWMLALALGLRQGETLGLRWCDVELENEYLTKLRRTVSALGTSTAVRRRHRVAGRRGTARTGCRSGARRRTRSRERDAAWCH
jgi:integrase